MTSIAIANDADATAEPPLARSRSGIMVAVLGGPGTGKSTVTKALAADLAISHAAQRVYLGSGDGDRSPARSLLHMMRQSTSGQRPRSAPSLKPDRARGRAARAFDVLWALSLARERRGKLRLISRQLAKGRLVITDRFPQVQLDGYNDGPLLGWLGGFLARWERRQYDPATMPAPDLVIKLVAAPHVLQQRRPTLDPAALQKKQDGIVQLAFPHSPILVLDAAEPFDQVVGKARQAVERMVAAQSNAAHTNDAKSDNAPSRGSATPRRPKPIA